MELEFSTLDSGEDGEYNDIDFVEISEVFSTQNAFNAYQSRLREYNLLQN